MEDYLRKSRFASAMDEIGFHFLAILFSLGWFGLLWGLRLPAIMAGCALYGLILLLRRKTRDDRLKRKEDRLRERIGGELALERLMMLSPVRAHFETAMLLSLRRPMVLVRALEAGVLCQTDRETVLVSFSQLPASASLDAPQVLSLQRSALSLKADRAVLCAPCAVSQRAADQAPYPLPVSFLRRDALIRLFGQAAPVDLGKRRRGKSARRIPDVIFAPGRGKTYAWYGCLLLGMYAITRFWIYALPGLICVFLAAACRCVHVKTELF